jgi:pimeloyl-ACP methyl ester carboxylesterase
MSLLNRPIYVLPGLGADHTMFSGAWLSLPNSNFFDWPEYNGEVSIHDLALRMTAEHKIKEGSILIGVSLGGMVACEIAKMIPNCEIILVSSAKKKEEMSKLYFTLSSYVDLAPIEFIQKACEKFPTELAKMFSRSQAAFMRAMCQAIFKWDGLGSRPRAPLRIHGKGDLLIPLPEGMQYVMDGGHLIAITHADRCVEVILSELERLS